MGLHVNYCYMAVSYKDWELKKILNTRLRAIWTRGSNFASYWKSLEQLKTNLSMSSTFFCPNFSSPFVDKMALSTSRVMSTARSGLQWSFQRYFLLWPFNKHLINRASSVCMAESWPRSLVQTSLRSVCAGELGQDPPIQNSRSVNKKRVKSSYWSIINAVL